MRCRINSDEGFNRRCVLFFFKGGTRGFIPSYKGPPLLGRLFFPFLDLAPSHTLIFLLDEEVPKKINTNKKEKREYFSPASVEIVSIISLLFRF